jgi:AAA-like domain/TIR domain/CHAT domain
LPSATVILLVKDTPVENCMSSEISTKKILILAANPKDTSKLRLDEEVRAIKQRLRQAKERDTFVVESEWAVRTSDIQQALFDFEPQIVHFCGHGVGEEGLAFENDSGQAQLVSATALAGLFKLFKSQVECVLLNACYSEVQAAAIAKHIPYVVGMKQAIGDKAAIAFADGFYGALGAGRSFEDAFAFGSNRIHLEKIPEHLTPVLKAKRKPKTSSNQKQPTQPPGKEPMPKANVPEMPRSSGNTAKVFISYRTKDPDLSLAQEFYEALKAAGHEPFLAGESIRLGDYWSERIDRELEQCDYFLLLLSPQSATSEMVTEEVRRAKQLHDTRPGQKPILLPIRVNFPFSSPLNYDLRGYLQRIQQREWESPADTSVILQEILSLLAAGGTPEPTAVEETEMQPPLEDLHHPPLPVAEPELPEGQVKLASSFYIDRPPIERKCSDEILTPGALIRIKAPRQMGKTSLMARVLQQAGVQGYQTVPLSFQLADGSIFADLKDFLQWFCASVSWKLGLPERLEGNWSRILGAKVNCTNYFEQYILSEIASPLALGLDEVDLVFQHPEIAADFFGLLRAWHEEAKDKDLWKKLRLVVVHSTEVYIPMNINQSPFNVGLSIELPEFQAQAVLELAQRHELRWNLAQVEQLMQMVGGHPYLVRVALYHIARGERTLEQLLQIAPTESGPYGDHLRRHWWNLKQHPELAAAIKQAIPATRAIQVEPMQAFKLHSMGLVHLQGNEVTLRCNLYRDYFRDRMASL